jgi:hypothetical protein
LCLVAEEVRESRSLQSRESTQSRENTSEPTEDSEKNSFDRDREGKEPGQANIADMFQKLGEIYGIQDNLKTTVTKTKGKKKEKDQELAPIDTLVPDSATSASAPIDSDSAPISLATLASASASASAPISLATSASASASASAPIDSASAPISLATSAQTVNDLATEHTDTVNGAGPSLPVQSLVANDNDQAKIVPMDVDEENVTIDSSISTNIEDASKAPAWLTASGMLDYLRGISEEKAWQDLISSFLKFEIENTTTGVSNYVCIHYRSSSSSIFRTYPLLRVRKRLRRG